MSKDIELEDFNTESEDFSDNGNNKKKKKKKKSKAARVRGHVIRSIIAVLVITGLYCTAVFSNIPFVAKWRTIYIETAMSTMEHQWLATYFIPNYIIEDIVNKKNQELAVQQSLQSSWDEKETESEEETEEVDEETKFFEKYWELNTVSFKNYLRDNPSVIANGYDNIIIDDLDQLLGIETVNGDPLVALDTANNVMIVAMIGNDYQGKLAIVKDTNQVDLVKASTFGTKGELVETLAENNDAILAINASHFMDAGGHGSGASVKGSLVIDGVEYGLAKNGYWRFGGVKKDGKLHISSAYTETASDYRWGVEAFPALIIDGENVVDGTLGMGIQPRTAIGQTQSGDFLMLIIDGRQVGYSLGCTVQDCSDMLMSYKCYESLNLDGGSSSVMWYKGQQITKSSSGSGRGRFGPDALIVRSSSLKLNNGSDCYNFLFQ